MDWWWRAPNISEPAVNHIPNSRGAECVCSQSTHISNYQRFSERSIVYLPNATCRQETWRTAGCRRTLSGTPALNKLILAATLAKQGGPSEDPIARRIRVTWWECWTTDIMMAVTCRQKRNLQGVVINVHLPSKPACLREPGCPVVWVSFPSVSHDHLGLLQF